MPAPLYCCRHLNCHLENINYWVLVIVGLGTNEKEVIRLAKQDESPEPTEMNNYKIHHSFDQRAGCKSGQDTIWHPGALLEHSRLLEAEENTLPTIVELS